MLDFHLLFKHRKCSFEQWLRYKLFSPVKRSKTRVSSISIPVCFGSRIVSVQDRQDKEIQGIKIFGKELKLSQFADDTTLLNSKIL